jgi:hypothetical protein
MISRTQQNWTPGSVVKVGFMSLMVQAAIETPKNYAPDAYLLSSSKGQNYLFVPHKGIEKYDGDTSIEAIQTYLF